MTVREELNEITDYNPLLLLHEEKLSNSLGFNLFMFSKRGLAFRKVSFSPASPPLWSRCRAKQRPDHDCSSHMVLQYSVT